MIDTLLPLFLRHESFVLTTHLRPDGDALGSQLALGRFLEKMGKRVLMINTDPAPYNLSWMPGVEDIEVFKGGVVRQIEQIHEADVLVILDTNSADRIGTLGTTIKNSDAVKVLIDHHPGPEDWFDPVFHRESASSTGELVYELIAAHDPGLIDHEIATALYTAIMTDTGSFRFSSVTAAVHRCIADLIDRGGLAVHEIHSALFDTRSVEGVRLLSRTLGTLTLLHSGQLGYVTVPQAALRETQADVAETEGIVNYVLSIEGVKVAMIFTETEKGTKVSFRSKGTSYVHKWAQSLGGGGHRNASGAFLRRSLSETRDAVLRGATRFLDLEPPPRPEYGALSPEDLALLSALTNNKS